MWSGRSNEAGPCTKNNNNQQPTTNNQQPTTNNQQPTTTTTTTTTTTPARPTATATATANNINNSNIHILNSWDISAPKCFLHFCGGGGGSIHHFEPQAFEPTAKFLTSWYFFCRNLLDRPTRRLIVGSPLNCSLVMLPATTCYHWDFSVSPVVSNEI